MAPPGLFHIHQPARSYLISDTLFRGFLGILHGAIDFADWIALLAYAVWLDFLFHAQYTEEDLAKLEMLRQDMKSKMLGSQLFHMRFSLSFSVHDSSPGRVLLLVFSLLVMERSTSLHPGGPPAVARRGTRASTRGGNLAGQRVP